MSIRIATIEDVPTLFDIRTSVRENHMDLEQLARAGVTPQSVAEMIQSSSRVWVADVEGRDVAFSMANASEATIFAMFVRPGFEGRGLGRALMREAEAWLCAAGFGEVWLLTSGDPTIRAHGFYLRVGWEAVGVQADGQIKYVRRCNDLERPADVRGTDFPDGQRG